MAIQSTEKGGIYVPIDGDPAPLKEKLEQVTRQAKTAGDEIERAISGTTTRASRKAKDDLTGMERQLKKTGKAAELAFSIVPGGLAGAITAIGVATYEYITAAKEASGRTERYKSTVDDLGKSVANAALLFDGLREEIVKMSSVEAGVRLDKAKEDVNLYRQQLEKLKTTNTDFGFDEFGEIDITVEFDKSKINDAINGLLDMKLNAEEYRKAVFEAVKAGEIPENQIQKFLTLGNYFLTASNNAGMLKQQTEGVLSAISKINIEKVGKDLQSRIDQAKRTAQGQTVATELIRIGVNSSDIDKFGNVSKEAFEKYNAETQAAIKNTQALAGEFARLTVGARESAKAASEASRQEQKAITEALRAAKEQVQERQRQEKEATRIAAENARTRLEFNREYLEVMQGSEAAQIAAIQQRAEEYRKAGAASVEVAQWQAEMELLYSRDASAGMIRAFKSYSDDATNSAKQIETLTTNAFKGMEDALVNFVMTGKMNFHDLANSIISDLIRIAAQQAIGGIAKGILGGLGSLFNIGGDSSVASGGGSLSASANFGSMIDFGGSSMKFASGGVLDAPSLAAYTNRVITAPTMFNYEKHLTAFAKGGIMGEAGAEAIMPLTRKNGRLGVDASGMGGGNTQPVVNVIVNAPPGVAVTEQKQTPNATGGFDMTIMLEMVDKSIASGIASGRSQTASALRMRQM